MTQYIIRRLLWIGPVLFAIAAMTFMLMHAAPGGPWDKERPVNAATQRVLNARFGLDKPLWFNPQAGELAAQRGEGLIAQAGALLDSQFWNYMGAAVRGHLGPSYQKPGMAVEDILLQGFPASAKLGVIAVVFALLVGLPLGILSALRQNSLLDYTALFISTVGIAVPSFVIALVLIILMARVFNVPVVRRPEEWQGLSSSYLLPGLVLGLGTMAYIMRLTRASMIEVKRQDYVRTAHAKGLNPRLIIARHMLRNSLIPVVTILGPAIADLVTGSFIIESIFGVPGIGAEFVQAIGKRDYSMLMGTTLVYALLVALANLMVDLSYGVLDPRIRVRR